MKWFIQYFLAPFIAALITLVGNYYLVVKPQLSKDYTKISLDILKEEDVPRHMKKYAQELLKENSPIELTKSEKGERLEFLLSNIPVMPVDLPREEFQKTGDLVALAMMYLDWSREIKNLCSDCVSVDQFTERFRESKEEILSSIENTKLSLP